MRQVEKGYHTRMNERRDTPDYPEIARHEQSREGTHHHRGKSSESLLDKDKTLKALGIERGQTILDAGCGNGYMSREFSQQVADTGKVYAVDPDEIGIAALRQETEGTNILAMVADITVPTELPAAKFDLIYLSTVIHGFSVKQLDGFKTEVKRLLAPRGKLAIVEIVKRATPFGPPLETRFSPEELKNALGFTPIGLVDVGEYFYMETFEHPPRAK